MSLQTGTDNQPATRYDAIVVGAGFSGLRILHEVRTLGLSVRVLDAGSDVGGTWHWNRYPGARTDSESWVYCYSFDKDLQDSWKWGERYPSQREVESYLRHVADRFDMRKDIEFGTRVVSAQYGADTGLWTVTTDCGQAFECTYFICGSGFLSKKNEPPFPGLDSFGGEWYETSNWPTQKVDFAGKRVAVVGTGSSGVQVVPVIAHTAAHLTVYQRTPNYVLPGRNRVLEDHERQGIKTNYDAIWQLCREQVFGFPIEPANRVAGDMATADEFEQVLEAGWEAGGFRYMFETFDDLLVDSATNERAAEFVRRKIRAIVKDPKTAELLCPTGYPIGGKRPPLGYWYFEAFNRPNVELVSVKDNPIEAVTPTGIRLADGSEQEFDVIVFALGFDAGTGAMSAMDIRGRDGRTIRDEWSRRSNNYLGITIEGFPNVFMLFGPGCAFANAPVLIEYQAQWIGRAIAHSRDTDGAPVEPTVEAVRAWEQTCEQAQQATVIHDGAAAANSWFVGANIVGKRQGPLVYFGALSSYAAELAKEIESGFPNVLAPS
jgi:cyclohexanone monooxygenase